VTHLSWRKEGSLLEERRVPPRRVTHLSWRKDASLIEE
jgi:hypothetical protein